MAEKKGAGQGHEANDRSTSDRLLGATIELLAALVDAMRYRRLRGQEFPTDYREKDGWHTSTPAHAPAA
jgi:hypothetical protein